MSKLSKIELEEEDNNVQITIVRGPKREDENDNVNQEVTFQKKQESTPKVPSKVEKGHALKEDNKDYWPDDWKDEE